MAKKNQEPKEEVSTSDPKRVARDLRQFNTWRDDLKRYWPEMDKWQEMYEFYKSKSERSETDTNISLNTPFAIVESQIAKENQANVKITVKAKPDYDVGEFDEWVECTLKGAIEDPDVAEIHGTFRKTKEQWSRALKISGNSVAEINYCYKTQVIDGKKKVIADNPYVKTRSFKSVIFNPAMNFMSSDVYYVEDYVDMSDLTGQEQKEEVGADGKTTKKVGLYTNLGELKIKLKQKGDHKDLADDTEIQYISGDTKINRKNKPIRVITKWQGTKMTVIAETGASEGVIIREAIDPLKLGGHNLLLGMRYVIEGRPYAYGEIAAIYKPVRAQDTIVAQGIEIVNRYLRGSYILGSDINIDEFMLVLANGGAMAGDGQSVQVVPVNQVPSGAFQSIDILEQAIERAARFSLYGAGLTNQAGDKTQGTKGGIQSIQSAAEPNVEIQLDDIEEMFMEPLARKYLKMIARLMSEDEVRYGFLEGQNKQWVKSTKGILMGEATLKDFLTVGLIDEKEFEERTTTLEAAVDPMSGQSVINPTTGQPQMQPVPIPGAEEALVFDIDWVVEAKLNNQSAADKEATTQKELQIVGMAQQMGVPLSPDRTVRYFAQRADFESFEELILTPEEQQKQQQAQMQQMQAQQQSQQAEQGQQMQGEMQKQGMQQQHQKELEQMKQQGAMQQAQMKMPAGVL